MELTDLASRATESVVLLKILDHGGRVVGTGSGFFVGDGLVATNHHVIEPASRVVAVFDDGTEVPVDSILAEDERNDLALLQIQGGNARPLPLFPDRVSVGESIAVIGSPLGLAGTLSTGIVSAYRGEGLEGEAFPVPLIQISAPISSGSSGSPVMNFRGEVIGVAVSKYQGGENLGFAVPTSILLDLQRTMDPSGVPVRSLGASASKTRTAVLGRNLLISALVFTALIVGLRRLR